MRKVIDLTGQRFGRLVVLNIVPNDNHRTTWLCICDCGNKHTVRGDILKRGKSKSCGCLREEHPGIVAAQLAAVIKRKNATHCRKGHPFDEHNTYIQPPSGNRLCRTCSRERYERRRHTSGTYVFERHNPNGSMYGEKLRRDNLRRDEKRNMLDKEKLLQLL